MDPQQRFIASTLQGALDADVLTLKDLFEHLPPEVLAEYIAPGLLWACLTEGMAAAGLGFEGGPATAYEADDEKAAPPPLPSQAPSEPPPAVEASALIEQETEGESDVEEEIDEVSPDQVEESVDFDVTEDDVDDLLDAATSGEAQEMTIDGDEVIEDLPPLPVDEALIVEEVNWGDDLEE